VVFEKEYIMRCSSAEWIARIEMMPSWGRQVNWGNCGIPWVNCAVFCVKDDWKWQFWGLRYCCQNCAVYSVFPSGMTSHGIIAQFNWVCIGRLIWYISNLLYYLQGQIFSSSMFRLCSKQGFISLQCHKI